MSQNDDADREETPEPDNTPPAAQWGAKRTYREPTVYHRGTRLTRYAARAAARLRTLEAFCGETFVVHTTSDTPPDATEEPDEQDEDGTARTKAIHVCEECSNATDYPAKEEPHEQKPEADQPEPDRNSRRRGRQERSAKD